MVVAEGKARLGPSFAGAARVENRRKRRSMRAVRAEQIVNDLAEETLARQVMALIQRSGEPLFEVLEDILESPAGRQPEELRGDPH
jgi:hypothetical protein